MLGGGVSMYVQGPGRHIVFKAVREVGHAMGAKNKVSL